MAGIRLTNLIKRYGKFEAVKNVNLEVEDGEFTVLVGPSGCGKSTTLRMIAGLEDISDGEIHDLKIEPGSTKKEVEIAKWVEIAEIGTIFTDAQVIVMPERFGAAEGIPDLLSEEKGKEGGKKTISQQVEESHGFFIHRVDETATVDKFSLAACKQIDKFR